MQRAGDQSIYSKILMMISPEVDKWDLRVTMATAGKHSRYKSFNEIYDDMDQAKQRADKIAALYDLGPKNCILIINDLDQ